MGLALFKWSRDNAARAVAVTDLTGNTVTLASLGRDQASALHQGDLVELTSEASELGPAHGFLTTLATDPDPDLFTVSLSGNIPPSLRPDSGAGQSAADLGLVLRRWDGSGIARSQFLGAATLDLNLDTGVQIQFGGRDLRPGDYWNFCVRSVDGSVQALNAAPPTGILRSYCPLALVRWSPVPIGSPPSSPPTSGQFVMTVESDCRQIFSPLTSNPRRAGRDAIRRRLSLQQRRGSGGTPAQ